MRDVSCPVAALNYLLNISWKNSIVSWIVTLFSIEKAHSPKKKAITTKITPSTPVPIKIPPRKKIRNAYSFKKYKNYSIPKQHFFGCNAKRPETWAYKIDLRG